MAGPLLIQQSQSVNGEGSAEERAGLLPPLASDTVFVLTTLSLTDMNKWNGLTGSHVPFHVHSSSSSSSSSEHVMDNRIDGNRNATFMASSLLLVNGHYQPLVRAHVDAVGGLVHRLRMVSANVKDYLLIAATVYDERNSDSNVDNSIIQCQFYLTAADGTPLRRPKQISLTSNKPLLIVPGSRKDIVFSCHHEYLTSQNETRERKSRLKEEKTRKLVFHSVAPPKGRIEKWVGVGTDVSPPSTILSIDLIEKSDGHVHSTSKSNTDSVTRAGMTRTLQSYFEGLSEISSSDTHIGPDWSILLPERLFPRSMLSNTIDTSLPPARHFSFVFNEPSGISRKGVEMLKTYSINNHSMPDISTSMSMRTSNDHMKTSSSSSSSSVYEVPLHGVEEWHIFNADSKASHPFHLHTNHFVITAITAVSNEYDGEDVSSVASMDYAVGDWRDTISIAPRTNVTIRWRANDFTGLLLAHCHITSHSDTGMSIPLRIV
jgi:FtsP/CotA-like multicopper oxidase with cupredoxin domain